MCRRNSRFRLPSVSSAIDFSSYDFQAAFGPNRPRSSEEMPIVSGTCQPGQGRPNTVTVGQTKPTERLSKSIRPVVFLSDSPGVAGGNQMSVQLPVVIR
ncbi:MAG: hypothetical protein D6741_13075 [Planctomycetota bacterium]|nr:MAG: hypothetical protein D6741_13075 [Planctomycetota bacterium]